MSVIIAVFLVIFAASLATGITAGLCDPDGNHCDFFGVFFVVGGLSGIIAVLGFVFETVTEIEAENICRELCEPRRFTACGIVDDPRLPIHGKTYAVCYSASYDGYETTLHINDESEDTGK